MPIFNKNFWKFFAGFLGILAVSIAMLWTFRYWQNYQEEQQARTLINNLRNLQKNN